MLSKNWVLYFKNGEKKRVIGVVDVVGKSQLLMLFPCYSCGYSEAPLRIPIIALKNVEEKKILNLLPAPSSCALAPEKKYNSDTAW